MRLLVALAAIAFAGTPLTGAIAQGAAVSPGHVPQPSGLYQGAMHGYTPNGVTGGTVLETAALAKLMQDQHPVLLDVAEQDRKPPNMDKDTPWLPTHRTIPGAVFLPGGGSGTDDPAYVAAFTTRLSALTGGDKGRPVVTFCHPDCWGSYNTAKRLVGLGYLHVYWDREGVEGWQADHDTRSIKPDAAWLASLPAAMTQ